MKKPLDKKAFVIATLRRGSRRWPPRTQAMKRARVKVVVGTYKNGKVKAVFKPFCEHCGTILFNKREDVKDHVIPVVDPIKGFTGWNDYVERMYPDTEWGFQILCKPCHHEKTQIEGKERRLARKNKNNSVKINKKLAKFKK